MNILKKIQKQDELDNKIKDEKLKKTRNESLYFNAKRSSSYLIKNQEIVTDFEYMDQAFDSDGELIGIYKQWEVIVYVSDDLENQINFILPFLKYEIIFNEGVPNNISYYNSHEDLHVSKFYEIKDNSLILKPSVYIKKVYGSADFIIPQVKLRISYLNSIKNLN